MSMRLMGSEGGRIATGVAAVVLSACGDIPAVPIEPSSLEVVSTTTGVPLPEGYTISVNGSVTGSLDNNGSLVLADLEAGEYVLELSGLPADCRVTGENPRTIVLQAGTTIQTVFQVRCIPPNSGTMLIRTATYGNGPTRYEIVVDDGLFVESLANDELLTLFPVPVGTRRVMIGVVPADCQLVGANPRNVIVREPGSITGTVFKIHCPE